MNQTEFIAKVQTGGREQPAPALKCALDYFLEVFSEPYNASQVAQAVQLAGRFAIFMATGHHKAAPLPAPREVVISDKICDELDPEIKNTRNNIFGSDRIPFRSPGAAVRWIESTSKQEIKSRPPYDGQAAETVRRKLITMTGRMVDIKRPMLDYIAPPSNWIHSVPTLYGGKLYSLAGKCKSIGDKTGFWPATVLWWILRGQRPILPRVRIQGYRRSDGPSFISLEINGRFPTWRETWQLFKRLQSNIETTGRPASARLNRIIQLVEARKGIPAGRGEKQKLWETIRLNLEKEFGHKAAPGTWQAIRKAYLKAKVR